ncbi:putative ubiquitin-conjugating enzyme E2 [Monocercomonoides exilis]|uniref:putative ubiquitin-conjugating enzyme E2 n=1 Tax=Monocercomonoides exilis TaxID=2049356 RepID=UPI00355A5FB6|nr:putative ubiquitin-conjugating enzyme E2 [Monocercomonoides exilis]|eukprot:MONOS_1111.1-p1 / transcript=MONOS_1111.1 / gene=MONOS_1111 / organism=Monocercomonoides_exilis_PA203 / gene_product=putative ubiquitin-conjugating enzyme E2 / transcript_product=putative ubiquitin-conjugating enzyme E2 / location=Mono_scaffold00019:1826-4116(+) / protein_length=649 / sequence_SO=supercontig / SO=protein_coding / is_pseudo=false
MSQSNAILEMTKLLEEEIKPAFIDEKTTEIIENNENDTKTEGCGVWKKGVGYGSDDFSISHDWSAIDQQEEKEQKLNNTRYEALQKLLNVFQTVPVSDFPRLAEVITSSSFLQIIEDVIVNDSFLSIAKSLPLYLACIDIIRKLNANEILFRLLFISIQPNGKSLFKQLKNLYKASKTFLLLREASSPDLSQESSIKSESSQQKQDEEKDNKEKIEKEEEFKEIKEQDKPGKENETTEDKGKEIVESKKTETEDNCENEVYNFALRVVNLFEEIDKKRIENGLDETTKKHGENAIQKKEEQTKKSDEKEVKQEETKDPKNESKELGEPTLSSSTESTADQCASSSSVPSFLSVESSSAELEQGLNQRYISRLQPLQFSATENSTLFKQRHSMAGRIEGKSMNVNSKRIMQELTTLSTSLPLCKNSSVFVVFDPSEIRLVKAMISGPKDTPYEGGLYEFDINFPENYPNCPPNVEIVTTGGGTFRFNPNLYEDGMVCLSLLGTWDGDEGESWNADHSTLLQVLISIQALILVEEPYYNEPGYETYSQTKESEEYNRPVRQHNITLAVLDQIEKAKKGETEFADVILNHFAENGEDIIKLAEKWKEEGSSILQTDIEKLTKEINELRGINKEHNEEKKEASDDQDKKEEKK